MTYVKKPRPYELTCRKCHFNWHSRVEKPIACPNCHTHLWNRDKIIGIPKGVTYLKVVRLRKDNPCFRLKDISKIVGVSNERVRQILSNAKLSTRHEFIKRFCRCGNTIQLQNKSGFCQRCNRAKSIITLQCGQCNTFFPRSLSEYNRAIRKGYKHIWCSKKCQGIWLGNGNTNRKRVTA